MFIPTVPLTCPGASTGGAGSVTSTSSCLTVYVHYFYSNDSLGLNSFTCIHIFTHTYRSGSVGSSQHCYPDSSESVFLIEQFYNQLCVQVLLCVHAVLTVLWKFQCVCT